MSHTYVVGLMSGTSIDGIDAALVKIKDTQTIVDVDLVHFTSLAYSDDIKVSLLELCYPETSRLDALSRMNMYLGDLFADAAVKVITEAGMCKQDITLIASHGQTIFHQPEKEEMAGKMITSTLQIGDISMIAEKTGITTVGDFRPRDMSAGGQGAPLVPYADYLLFTSKTVGRALVNIGGIANITILPRKSDADDVIAYDTGPGNMIIDAFVRWATDFKETFDEDGKWAAKGKINVLWLNELLTHDYFHQALPKTTGREQFGTHYAEKLWDDANKYQISHADRIATITELTARTIAEEIKKHATTSDIKEVLISGGGRYNSTLMKRITAHLPAIKVKPTDDYNMDADAKEAIVFALLGYQCYHKRPNNLPSATGASHPVIMGKIAWGS